MGVLGDFPTPYPPAVFQPDCPLPISTLSPSHASSFVSPNLPVPAPSSLSRAHPPPHPTHGPSVLQLRFPDGLHTFLSL